MPQTFSVTLNKKYNDLLVNFNGSYGDKANFLRLALKTHLITMTPRQYGHALSQEQGPHPHKATFAVGKNPKWYEALKAKAAQLETTPAEVGRVCLCQFLDDLKREEQDERYNKN